MKGERQKAPWWFFLLAGLILTTALVSKYAPEGNWVLIPVALTFLVGFGVLLIVGIKEWKKTDEQVLEGFFPAARLFSGPIKGDMTTHAGNFIRTSVVTILFLIFASRDSGRPPVPFLILTGLALLATAFPMLRLWLGSNTEKDNGPPYRTAAVIALLLGLVTTLFMLFWIGIGIYHGAWWFTLPPGLIFLVYFSRNLAAGIRTLFKKKSRGKDPWDGLDNF